MSKLDEAVSRFGAALKDKLSSPVATGEPEDQLRTPTENLFEELGPALGKPKPTLVGEVANKELKARPDFAATLSKALVGHIELKAPGKGADPRKFRDGHDAAQWAKLKALPNLIYTDGSEWSLWRDGELQCEIVELEGDIETAGSKLRAPSGFAVLITDFLEWTPIKPRSVKELAHIAARLCRLLRDEVTEEMALKNAGLTDLAKDWRKLLFPEATAAQFADGYAQAVTFGLLMAKARGLGLADGIHDAAQELKQSNSLIGTALGLLTDEPGVYKPLKTSLDTLARVLDVVDWPSLSKDKPEAWLYFYEDFLEVYDNALRKRTGSYYTPPEVVAAMVRLVDEALRGPLFERKRGLASPDVTVADPAVGTGTFLLGVLARIAETVKTAEGPGAVRGQIEAAAKRIVGFELQFGPFAVAQLRLVAELQALMADVNGNSPPAPELRLYITDTLGNPYIEEDKLQQSGPIAKSRRDANAIKKSERITVVLGNPPYKVDAAGRGGWIEEGSTGISPMDLWTPPRDWGVGASTNLKNLYVFFWRWATWKVFGSGHIAQAGLKDTNDNGVVCFITAAGFLNGPGFQKMRAELRRDCSDIWVIDCTPEGMQPEVRTRIFEGVQQEVCIVLAARKSGKDCDTPGRVRFFALPQGRREDKFAALAKLPLDESDWVDAPSGWRDPFLPEHVGLWRSFRPLLSLFDWSGPGVKTHRTWIIAPDAPSLADRWELLKATKDTAEKIARFRADDSRGLGSLVRKPLGSHELRSKICVDEDEGPVVEPVRYAFRSFDRQWIIPDHRLISRARPVLWGMAGSRQVFLTALADFSPSTGPAFSFAAGLPDMHHYHGRGGRVLPLWRDAAGTQSNVSRKVLQELSTAYGRLVSPEDVMAYLAAVLAHPAFTARFEKDLVRPGLRVPLTAEAALFDEAVAIGREVVWLHTYGERFADPAAGRPKESPRLPPGEAPIIPAGGAIPSDRLPEDYRYELERNRLHIGGGHIDNVTPAMMAYEVSGKQIVHQWFSYRRADRSKPVIGDNEPRSDLDNVKPVGWLAEYTTDLLDLLNVLGRLVKLEPKQADLLHRILAADLLGAEELTGAGAIPKPEEDDGETSPASLAS